MKQPTRTRPSALWRSDSQHLPVRTGSSYRRTSPSTSGSLGLVMSASMLAGGSLGHPRSFRCRPQRLPIAMISHTVYSPARHSLKRRPTPGSSFRKRNRSYAALIAFKVLRRATSRTHMERRTTKPEKSRHRRADDRVLALAQRQQTDRRRPADRNQMRTLFRQGRPRRRPAGGLVPASTRRRSLELSHPTDRKPM